MSFQSNNIDSTSTRTIRSHHSAWYSDSVNVDTILTDTNFMQDIEAWAGDSSLAASMGARAMLEFLNERLLDAPQGEYLISEYSVYPSSSPAKRGYNDSEDDEDSDESLNSFSAYPNPFGSSIIFDISAALVDEIIITDIRGVLVDKINVGENQSRIEWQAQQHAAGVYIAVAHRAGQSKTLKIIKY